jgi:mono/diheme cytochrome c family protein
VSSARAACVALLLALAAAPAAPASDAATPDLLVRGAAVFRERCSPCHGDRGHGDGILADVLPVRPRNYFEESFRWGHQPEQIAETVRRGRSGVMPGFANALSDRDIWAVANLVHLWATGGAAQPW